MNKIERLTKNVEQALKEKRIKFKNPYYTTEYFIRDSLDYIKAIKERRMIVGIMAVSSSGMTRWMQFASCQFHKKQAYYRRYGQLFQAIGYTLNKSDEIKVSGCGMDMVFHTNYTTINFLQSLGFLSEKEARILAQQTPQYM